MRCCRFLFVLVPSLGLFCIAQSVEGQEKFRIEGLNPYLMMFSSDSTVLAFVHGADPVLTGWDLNKQEAVLSMRGDHVSRFVLRYTPDNSHIIMPCRQPGVPNGAMIISYDANSGKAVKKIISPALKAGHSFCDLSTDGRFLLTRPTRFEGRRLLWDLETGKSTALEGDYSARYLDVLSADASLAAAMETYEEAPVYRLKIWDTATGKLLKTMTTAAWAKAKSGADRLAFSDDKKIIAVAGIKHLRVRFFDVKTGEELGEVQPTVNEKAIWPVGANHFAFLPDSKHVAYRSGDTPNDIEIRRISDLKKVATLRGKAEEMGEIRLAVSPDGRYLARSNLKPKNAGNIVIWELPKLVP